MNEAPTRRRSHRRALPAAWTLCVLFLIAGCDDSSSVRVQLHPRKIPNEPQILLEIEAQVSGPLTGLSYRWFAVSGECDPQESEQPKTKFRFREGVKQDRVTVEVMRGGMRVAQGETSVRFDDDGTLRKHQSAEARIEITEIPPAEQGGPDTRAHIEGNVSGNVAPDCLVVVYVRAFGYWFIQPIDRAAHPIHPPNSWGTWTHTGAKYAALLVKSNHEPLSKLDMLPEVGGTVLAVTFVDGKPKEPDAAQPAAHPPPASDK